MRIMRMRMRISLTGVAASASSLALCVIFLFWNPYAELKASPSTVLIVSLMLIGSAILGLLSSWLRNRLLMFISFAWSLPYGLYLAIASVPSVFNLFALVLILYFISALTMDINKSRSPESC
ncbi:putative membrane protein [Cohnella thailandensis]|nr:putative membrane protein [Cohnella thailandensis]